jgi:hypothetical protein
MGSVVRKEIHEAAHSFASGFPLVRFSDRKNRNPKEAELPDDGAGYASALVVIIAAGLLVAGMASLAFVILELRKAPEGYEDEHGFHGVRKGAVGCSVPCSMIQNIRRASALRSKPIFVGFL